MSGAIGKPLHSLLGAALLRGCRDSSRSGAVLPFIGPHAKLRAATARLIDTGPHSKRIGGSSFFGGGDMGPPFRCGCKPSQNTAMKTLHRYLLCGFVFLFACEDMGTEPAPAGGYSLYLLSDSSITAVKASGSPLGALVLAPEPFITARDIEAYHWSDQSIVFRPPTDSILHQMALWPYKSWGVPFVVVAEGERIYLGAFWWGYSNYLPPFPYIELITPSPFRIAWNGISSQPDPRGDSRIRDALQASGVLSE